MKDMISNIITEDEIHALKHAVCSALSEKQSTAIFADNAYHKLKSGKHNLVIIERAKCEWEMTRKCCGDKNCLETCKPYIEKHTRIELNKVLDQIILELNYQMSHSIKNETKGAYKHSILMCESFRGNI